MRKLNIIYFSLLILFCNTFPILEAAPTTTPKQKSSSTSPNSAIKQKTESAAREIKPKEEPQENNATQKHGDEEEEIRTLNPGIVGSRDGEWVWSDHLLNLSSNIEVVVEITKPDTLVLPITYSELETIVKDLFKKAGITPQAAPAAGKPNLPAFHILILIYPIRDGYTCSVAGRLFEEVTLPRIKLDETVTMQAITWDRSSIHVVSSGKLKQELIESVTDITNDFIERYQFFQKYKNSNK